MKTYQYHLMMFVVAASIALTFFPVYVLADTNATYEQIIEQLSIESSVERDATLVGVLRDYSPMELFELARHSYIGENDFVLAHISEAVKEEYLANNRDVDQLFVTNISTEIYRPACLWLLYALRDDVRPDNAHQLTPFLVSHALDSLLPAKERLASIVLVSHFLSSGAEHDTYGFREALPGIISDQTVHPEVRRAAIKTAVVLKVTSAVPDMLRIISDKQYLNNRPIARSACIALAHLGVQDAAPLIRNIMQQTSDRYIYGSAAVALGDLGGNEALQYLVNNEARFDGGECGSAIAMLDSLIIAGLSSSDHVLFNTAIQASQYLTEKDKTEIVKPVLMDIALRPSAFNRDVVMIALSRLRSQLSLIEANSIVPHLPEYLDPELIRGISLLAGGQQVSIQQSMEIVDEQSRGNLTGQEYGDPGYRNNPFDGSYLGTWGHTGLCAGINSANEIRILEVDVDNPVVEEDSWASMSNDDSYRGANTLNNSQYYMTFSRRRNVMQTAWALVGEDIGYPWFPHLDALRHVSNPGTYISPREVTDLRCDGFVEYCYELNNYWVWGKNGANYDISATANVDDHNNFPFAPPHNPDDEFAPYIQAGYWGGTSTHMNWAAQTDEPSYPKVSYTTSGHNVALQVTADDRSGIHYIKMKQQGGSWVSSPAQRQDPQESDYSWSQGFTMAESGWIYYYAKDNAGNYPQYANSVYVEVCPSLDSPSLQSPLNNASCQEASGVLDWSSVSGASGYQVQIGNTCGSGSTYITSSSSYSYSGLSAGQTYYWCARTKNNCDEWGSWSGCRNFTVAPSVPGVVSLYSPPNGAVCQSSFGTLDWGSVSNAVGYQVQIGAGCESGSTYSTSGSSYSYSGLIGGMTYYWCVRAKNTCGNWGNWTNCRLFTIEPPALAIPGQPSFTANPVCNGTNVTVSWGGVSAATGYRIYRDGTEIWNGTGTTYTSTAVAGTYTIAAYNDCGTGSQGPGAVLSVTSIPANPGAPSLNPNPAEITQNVLVQWSAVPEAIEYRVYRDGSHIATSSSTSYLLSAPLQAGDYSISAGNTCGWSATGPITTLVVNLSSACVIEPQTLHFSIGWDMLPVTLPFSITNTGGGLLEGNVTCTNDGYSFSPSSYSLEAGQSAQISVSYQPSGCREPEGGSGYILDVIDVGSGCSTINAEVHGDWFFILEAPDDTIHFYADTIRATDTREMVMMNYGCGDPCFYLLTGQLEFSAHEGGGCPVQGENIYLLDYTPADAGNDTIQVSLNDFFSTSGGQTPTRLPVLVGHGPLLPEGCEVSPSTLNMATTVGSSVTTPVTITNTGETHLAGALMSCNPQITIDPVGYDLQPGANTVVNVTLAPTAEPSFSCTITTDLPCNDIVVNATVHSEWTDVTVGPLGDTGHGQGVAWGDYDNDGDLDICVANWGEANALLRNDGAGQFVNVASGLLGDPGHSKGVCWGDYDNDGYLDLYLTNNNDEANSLLRNNGDGTFDDVTDGPLGDISNSGGSAWGDYDNDGYLDLYYANWQAANRLLRNDGGASFVDVTSGPLGNAASGYCVAWGDYDNDGDLDIYLAVAYLGPNCLFRNDRGGEFVDVTSGPLADMGVGTGAAWGDYDNDGDLDIYLANSNGGANKLFKNDGGGVFSDATMAPLGDTGSGQGVAWGDYDNDGDLDLYLANAASGSNKLFRNSGDGSFVEAQNGLVGDEGYGIGVAWADYDHDGDLDLYLANYTGSNKLFRNDVQNENHWLHVKLVGVESNRAGIGARVRIVSGGQLQIREVSGGSGHMSQNSLTVEFGLGVAVNVDSLKVLWPSGAVQVLTSIQVDQLVTVIEDDDNVSMEGDELVPEGVHSLQLEAHPNPFNPLTSITYHLPIPATVKVQIYDLQGKVVCNLVRGESESAGSHDITWRGLSDEGDPMPAGTYICVLRVGDNQISRKIMLIK